MCVCVFACRVKHHGLEKKHQGDGGAHQSTRSHASWIARRPSVSVIFSLLVVGVWCLAGDTLPGELQGELYGAMMSIKTHLDYI